MPTQMVLVLTSASIPTKLSDLAADMPLLHEAQAAAEELLSQDPELRAPENRPVLARVRRLFEDTGNSLN